MIRYGPPDRRHCIATARIPSGLCRIFDAHAADLETATPAMREAMRIGWDYLVDVVFPDGERIRYRDMRRATRGIRRAATHTEKPWI